MRMGGALLIIQRLERIDARQSYCTLRRTKIDLKMRNFISHGQLEMKITLNVPLDLLSVVWYHEVWRLCTTMMKLEKLRTIHEW